MNSHEILNQIRQIERRANRMVTETVSDFSFQPSAQFRGIAGTVENRNNADEGRFNREVNTVAVEDFESGLANGFAGEWKSFWVLKNAGQSSVDFGFEPVAQPRRLLLIPKDGLLELKPGFVLEDYLAGHARRCERRPLSSPRTFSQVKPNSGWRRSLSARSSNFAITSGGKSSAISSWSRFSTSNCPSKGSRRNSCMISVALTGASYSTDFPTQAEFTLSRAAQLVPRSLRSTPFALSSAGPWPPARSSKRSARSNCERNALVAESIRWKAR